MNGEESVEERSGIQGLFTESMAKVLDFLLTFEGFYYSKEEIARNSEIGNNTIYDLLVKLEYYGVVKEKRGIGKTMLYTLNTESPIVNALKKLQHEIMFYDADKITREQAEIEVEIMQEKGEKEKVKVKA